MDSSTSSSPGKFYRQEKNFASVLNENVIYNWLSESHNCKSHTKENYSGEYVLHYMGTSFHSTTWVPVFHENLIMPGFQKKKLVKKNPYFFCFFKFVKNDF